ncbi:MAG TPA: hypothetical protein VMR81_07840 [Patescibacteria group bacterium]|nr:hypothetical protein [Patescibacteria group bacterium]
MESDFPVRPDSIWDNVSKASEELSKAAHPVDYPQMVNGSKVLMLGETHGNERIGDHLIAHISELQKLGFTHYVIEAPVSSKAVIDTLKTDPELDLSTTRLGPDSDYYYQQIVRAMVHAGVEVVPIAMEKHNGRQDYEKIMVSNFTALLKDRAVNKVVTLIGGGHVVKNPFPGPELSLDVAPQLIKSGVSVSSAQLVGGRSDLPPRFIRAVEKLGLRDHEFMVDMRAYQIQPFDELYDLRSDYIVHLPKNVDHKITQ